MARWWRGAGWLRSGWPWLAAPFQQRLDRYDAQLAEVTATGDRALLAVRTLPALLGRDRPTRWFVAVANPAEGRATAAGDLARTGSNGSTSLVRAAGVLIGGGGLLLLASRRRRRTQLRAAP